MFANLRNKVINSRIYDNHTVIGDFNTEPPHTPFSMFMDAQKQYNFTKQHTCFEGPDTCIDYIFL